MDLIEVKMQQQSKRAWFVITWGTTPHMQNIKESISILRHSSMFLETRRIPLMQYNTYIFYILTETICVCGIYDIVFIHFIFVYVLLLPYTIIESYKVTQLP